MKSVCVCEIPEKLPITNYAFDVERNQLRDFFEFYIENYRYWLILLSSIDDERDAIRCKNEDGICDREILDPDWEYNFHQTQEHIRRILKHAERAIDAMPNTAEYIPCKIALRMRYFHGVTNIQAAIVTNVSISTVQRLYKRSRRYFADYTIDEEDLDFTSISKGVDYD